MKVRKTVNFDEKTSPKESTKPKIKLKVKDPSRGVEQMLKDQKELIMSMNRVLFENVHKDFYDEPLDSVFSPLDYSLKILLNQNLQAGEKKENVNLL